MNRFEAEYKGAGVAFADDPLFLAVRENDLDKVDRLIGTGEGDVNCVKWTYHQGLHCFVRSHDAFSILIRNGLLVDEHVLISLIELGLEIDSARESESDFACEILERLVDYGAPLDGEADSENLYYTRTFNRRPPIVHALFNHRSRFLEVLLRKGANPNLPDPTFRYTPLHWLVMHWENISFLRGSTQNGWPDFWDDLICREMCDLLLEYGADPYFSDPAGDTPLFTAARYCLPRPFEYLIDRGVSLLHLNDQGYGILSSRPKSPRDRFAVKGASHQEIRRVYKRCMEKHYALDPTSGEIYRNRATRKI